MEKPYNRWKETTPLLVMIVSLATLVVLPWWIVYQFVMLLIYLLKML